MAADVPLYPPQPSERYTDLEATAGTVEDSAADVEEAWARPAKRRRWDWRTGLAGLVAGLLLGAGAFHAQGKLRQGEEAPALKDEMVLLSPAMATNGSDEALLSTPVRIHYRSEDHLNRRDPILPPDCPVPVVYTIDEKVADIVVLSSDRQQGVTPEEMDERRRTRPWQSYAIWGVESAPNRQALDTHHERLKEGQRSETAEYEMTYRLNSTVPATYSYNYFNYDNAPVSLKEKRSDKIAVAFISNCHPKNARTLILDELISLLPGKIDSYGSCRNNANADETLKELGLYDSVGAHNNWNQKITMIGHYRFTIAFENSNDLDYVTEKYFQSLERGTVPLVFGAPDYARRFFPSPNAGIDVGSYLPANYTEPSRPWSSPPEALDDEAKAGLARLAKRLEHLSSDAGNDEYEAMLEWKKDGRWKRDPANPLGKIVRESTSRWAQDCRLAGVFRGQEWAKSGWTPP
ncbi:hypothetical protein JCM8097_007459 [Rhodosporidiobolus ruineniae]